MIIGDLADPIEGGPCYKLYTKSFYEHTVKPRLNQGGIFITQVYNRFWFLERERQRGRGRVEEIIIHHSCPVDFAGRASWNFQPYRSVFMHLQHFKAGVQM